LINHRYFYSVTTNSFNYALREEERFVFCYRSINPRASRGWINVKRAGTARKGLSSPLIRAAIDDREYEIKAHGIAKVIPSKCRGSFGWIFQVPGRHCRLSGSVRMSFPQRAFAQSISVRDSRGWNPFVARAKCLSGWLSPITGCGTARTHAHACAHVIRFLSHQSLIRDWSSAMADGVW